MILNLTMFLAAAGGLALLVLLLTLFHPYPTRKCHRCGGQVEITDRRCPRCGYIFEATDLDRRDARERRR